MDYKLIFATLLIAVGLALGQPVGDGEDTPCPQPGDDMPLHFRRTFGNCMRQAFRTLRESTDNCRDVVYGVKLCIDSAKERCMPSDGQMEPDRDDMPDMERHLNETVRSFMMVLCEGNFTMLPQFNKRNNSLPGCDAGYFTEVDRCTEDFESSFRADPLDVGLCEQDQSLQDCQREKLRDHCSRTHVSEDYLEEARELDNAGNFYCEEEIIDDDGAANSLKASLTASFLLSILFIVRMI